MEIGTLNLHTEKGEKVKVKFSNFDSFQTLEIGSRTGIDFKTQIFFQNLQDVINFKNSFINAFNKLMKEADYG